MGILLAHTSAIGCIGLRFAEALGVKVLRLALLSVFPQAKIRLKYRLSYEQGGQEVVEVGEASDFPTS